MSAEAAAEWPGEPCCCGAFGYGECTCGVKWPEEAMERERRWNPKACECSAFFAFECVCGPAAEIEED